VGLLLIIEDKLIEENLHVDFLENKSIEKRTGPDWLFDIDTLTTFMNYVPVVVAGTSSTNISRTKEDVHQAVKERSCNEWQLQTQLQRRMIQFQSIMLHKRSNKRSMEIKKFLKAVGTQIPLLVQKSTTNISRTKEDVHQAVKEKELQQMATSNAATTKDDAIPVNNALQQEQQEVYRDKEVPESSRNSNPTTSTKVFTNDLFELASSSTVETEVPTVSTHVPTDSLFFLRLEDFFGDTSNAVSLNKVEADLSNMETVIQ
nr:ribonuclease H-like domain-containing protein [Tanacetum cinerariifolium]